MKLILRNTHTHTHTHTHKNTLPALFRPAANEARRDAIGRRWRRRLAATSFALAAVSWLAPDHLRFHLVFIGFLLSGRIQSSWTGFYRVLMGFTGFYRALMGFSGFYRVFPGYISVLVFFFGVFNVFCFLNGARWVVSNSNVF